MTTETKSPEAIESEAVEPKTIIKSQTTNEPVKREIRSLSLDELNVEHSYQRPATKKMEQIGKAWKDELAGYPVISQRNDDSFWIIDGQHRIGGARIAGKTHMPVDIRHGLSLKEEAKLFDELNGQRSHVTAVDRYKAKMFYDDPEAMEITAIVESFGGEIATKSGAGAWGEIKAMAIRSVASLFRVYEQESPARLREILQIIHDAWGSIDYQTTNELTLAGINQFLNKKNPKQYNRDRLVDRLKTEGVTQIKRMAHAHSQIFGGSGPVNFYRAMVEAYNRNMPQKQRLRP